MEDEARYERNLEKFAQFNRLEAYRLDRVDCSQLNFCYTTENELNLVDTQEGKPHYFYLQEGAYWEAEQWARIPPLTEINTLFVYGLGLGYYYVPLKKWLKENRKHQLIFIEEDPRVVKRFLETELATELLNHPQVYIRLFPCLLERDRLPMMEFWGKFRNESTELAVQFLEADYHVSALQSYFSNHFELFDAFAMQWPLNIAQVKYWLSGYVEQISLPTYRNYYANLPYLSEAIPATNTAGGLHDIPVVLCGAGPSMGKQMSQLRVLKDRAIIVAAGSGMNALSRENVIPHIGGGIDPWPVQESRLLTSYGFNVPTFYQGTHYYKALKLLHGPRLHVISIKSTGVINWFENELGIAHDRGVQVGISTSNFLLDVGRLLESNPIVMAGMDLAYTNDARYTGSVAAHPTDHKNVSKQLTSKSDHLLQVPGVDGQEVSIKFPWFLEAMYIVSLKQEHPATHIVNATEGGMLIPTIPNMTLASATETYFHEFRDMEGWLHGIIQNGDQNRVKATRIQSAMTKWEESLRRSVGYLELLLEDLQENLKRVQKGEQLPYGPYSGRASLWQVELSQEVVYEQFLLINEKLYDVLKRPKLIQIQKLTNNEIRRQKMLHHYEIGRCKLLLKFTKRHLKYLCDGVKKYERIQAGLAKIVPNPLQIDKNRFEASNYLVNGKLQVNEPTLDVKIAADFQLQYIPKNLYANKKQPIPEALIGHISGIREGQTLYFYPDGKIKAEAFFKEGVLHGPWSFFGENGQLLAKSWYVNGEKQGYCDYYYRGGQLYSRKGYRDGKAQGCHEYYYPNGFLKAHENYLNGELDGIVQLYYSNGQCKRELGFKKGKQHGYERVWNESGKRLVEVLYEEGHSVSILG